MDLLKNLIKKYFATFAYFYRYLKHRVFIVLILGFIIGFLDAFGLTMFLPLLELANGNHEASGKNMGGMANFVKILNTMGIELTLMVALCILAGFFILKGLAVYFSEAYKVKVSQYFISTIRLRLTNLFTNYSFKNFVTADMGRIQNGFTGEVSRTFAAYNAYSLGIQEIIMTLVYMVFVFLIDWKFALLVCLGGILTNFIYGSIFKKTKKESIHLSQHNSNYHKSIIQYINNFKYLKATGFLETYAQKLKNDILKIDNTNTKIGNLNAIVSGMREPILILVVCIVILIQIYAFNGQLGTILMSLLLFYRALTQLLNFQTSYNNFLASSGGLENTSSFEKELIDNQDKKGAITFSRFKNKISLTHVDFGYNPDDLILKEINVTIPKNNSIAFVGESGSGKTTLVNLISGLLPISDGHLLIDGIEMSDLKHETYQKRIGYIAQEPVIFNDTIFNNVTFWAEPTPENKERFQKAVQQASILEFITTLNKKEETLLGNNGINLSGGQKQRISIARELYKDIDILILDEATSALDSETEREIQYNIDSLKGKYTIIIIAHRLSTIRNVDTIFLMSKGEILDSGQFEELTQKSEKFRHMVELQEI